MEQQVYEKVQKGRLRIYAEQISSRLNRQLSAHFGDSIPHYLVCEFPRSGGSWLANMMADYLRCGRPGASFLPFGFRCVIHNHWRYHPKFKRVVFLIRDGRDVMTSYYFYRIRSVKKAGYAGDKNTRRVEAALGAGFDPDNTAANLPKLMRYEFEHPMGAGPLNWAGYVGSWYDPANRPGILYLRYEELLADPVDALTRAIEHVSPVKADRRLIERSVEHHSMAKITGRAQGEENRNEFIRKGIAGDWQNYFTREAAEVFHHYAGDVLIRTGYEPDASWVEACGAPAPAEASAS